MAGAAADPGVQAGVFDSASMPRRRRPALPGPPLRAFSARTPSTPDIAARGTGAGVGRCSGVLSSSSRRWLFRRSAR